MTGRTETSPAASDDQSTTMRLYQMLQRIRRVEEEIARIYPSDKIKSPVHLSIGQESVAVGVCDALRDEDYVSATYRGHAAYLAKGGDLKKMIAELYGKDTGATRGKGGSMHLIDVEHGVLGTSAVVGTNIPVALGFALASKKKNNGRLVACFLGDGATEEGVFSESLNFASLHRLPVLFICENNGYAIHAPLNHRWATLNLCSRVETYGIPTERIDDGDVLAIRAAAEAAVSEIRAGSGPKFIECLTYRWKEHVGPNEDFQVGYRPAEEREPWKGRDPVMVLGAQLGNERRVALDEEIEAEIREAFTCAESDPFPEGDELEQFVFADPAPETGQEKPVSESSRILSYVQALNEAATQEMEVDPDVFMMGLGVDDHRGIMGSTVGMAERFGRERVMDTPISEDAMTGVAIGAAMAGMRPLHIHIRMDFLLLCMNQLVNMAAKAHYMFAGQVRVPLVVRCMIGRSWGQGAQHSQGLHAMFAHVPGLKVVAPSNAYDAKGCLIQAIRDDNPVIFMEHRLLYNTESYVSETPYTVPFGKARITAPGNDITIVGISSEIMECLRARELLKEADIEAEVIDPISLMPFDAETILDSVARTGRLLVVDTGWTFCGLSAEILAQVAESDRFETRPIVRRMGFAPTTCPTTPSLERHFYSNPVVIAKTAYRMARPMGPDWRPSPKNAEMAHHKEFRGPF